MHDFSLSLLSRLSRPIKSACYGRFCGTGSKTQPVPPVQDLRVRLLGMCSMQALQSWVSVYMLGLNPYVKTRYSPTYAQSIA
jgi:hypothetical protein